MALAVLAVLMASPVWAQQREAVMLETSPPPAYTPERGGSIEEIQRYNPDDGQAVYVAGEGGVDGFLFGTNVYGDIGKSVALELPDGWDNAQIIGFGIAIFRAASPTLNEIRLAAFTGDEASGPLAEIDGQNFPITDIEQVYEQGSTVPVQQFLFDDPIELDGNSTFHAAVTWAAGAGTHDFGIASSPELLEHSPYEWEQEGNGIWAETASNWGFNGANVWISAVVQDLSVSGEPGAQTQEITISSVYPNPVASQSSVDITTDRPQHASVEVFNLLGQRVKTVFEGNASAGTSILPINGAELAAGMYIVRLQGEDFTQSRKFVVAN